jgi:hypothetical protein
VTYGTYGGKVKEVAVYKKIILEIASHLHSLRFQIMTIVAERSM